MILSIVFSYLIFLIIFSTIHQSLNRSMEDKAKILRLEETAKRLVPEVISRKPPPIYFQAGKNYIVKAGKAKSMEDFETCYVYLRCYQM